MSSFTDRLIVSPASKKHWELVEEFEFYYFEKDGTKKSVIVPAGYMTDFASVPRFLYGLFPPYWTYTKATVVHDWLYHVHSVDRKKADWIFLEAMRVGGVGFFTRWSMYFAVRAFGWIGWN